MKGYGLPRHLDLQSPDKVDITYYGLAPHQYGEKRRSSVKKSSRRYWKRRERMFSKLKLKLYI